MQSIVRGVYICYEDTKQKKETDFEIQACIFMLLQKKKKDNFFEQTMKKMNLPLTISVDGSHRISQQKFDISTLTSHII